MSTTLTLGHYLSLGAILFAMSVIGIFLNRKNLIVLLMAIELMLLAVNTNFVAFSHYLRDINGQIFVFFILTVAAAESAQALVDSFRRQFEVGRKSWLEVLNAQREANDAVLQAITVRRNLWVANARLALQGLYWRRLSDRAPALHVIEDEDSDE